MKLYAYAIGAAGLVAAVWYYGHTRYNAGQDDMRAEVAEQVAKATAETASIDAERVKLSERIEHDLQPKIAAADANARSLARRLREYASRSSLPQAPGSTAEPTEAPGEPGDGDPVERATEQHFAACARDSERLAAWQEWYRELSNN